MVVLTRKRLADLSIDTWTTERVCALARMCNMTFRELCAQVGIYHLVEAERFGRGGKYWPIWFGILFNSLQTVYEEMRKAKAKHD